MGFIGMTEVMPCYKAFEIVARMSFSAACFAAEGICCEWLTKPERLYRLRKRPSRDELAVRTFAGAKARRRFNWLYRPG